MKLRAAGGRELLAPRSSELAGMTETALDELVDPLSQKLHELYSWPEGSGVVKRPMLGS